MGTWVGIQRAVLGLTGDISIVNMDYTTTQGLVRSVKRVREPYKKANREFHPDNTVTTLPGRQKIGNGSFTLIVSPCSVEDEK